MMESNNPMSNQQEDTHVHHNLSIGLFYCDALEDIQYNSAKILKSLQEVGAVFFHPALVDGPFNPPLLEDPTAELKAGRMAAPIDFTHESIEPLDRGDYIRWGFLGSVFTPGFRRSLLISCLGFRDDRVEDFPAAMHELSSGRVKFMKQLIVRLKPRFAYVDEVFDDKLRDKVLQDAGTRLLFWTTYFGPAYVEKHGKEFFLQAPAWKTEEFEGGVIVTATEHFLDFVAHSADELLKYFSAKFPRIKANRFSIPAWF
ncbi:MAG: hypothetical protein ACK52A_13180 [Planctomycetota bacterium]